jgi:2-keto-4-pentenoate hydratase/2-oxohepta-3-ene-1,7-dioic acid hydratase in catechol pathway
MEELRIQGVETVYRPGKLICVGRNYAEHAREMKSDLPTAPMLFLKPASALIPDGGTIVLPSMSRDVHHEVELVALIGTRTRNVTRQQARSSVVALAVGLDMTARDLQQAAKEAGLPWSVAKGFDTFAPIGPLQAVDEDTFPIDLEITLDVNGHRRQTGHTSDMIFALEDVIAYASSIFTLEPGDLIYTGTPSGVSAVHAGDRLEARAGGLPPLRVDVA